MKRRRAVRVLASAIVLSALWLSTFLYRYLDDLARHHSGTAPQRLLEELTGVASALVVIPILLTISRRVPWTRAAWPRALVANAAGAVVYTVAHTTLMAISRAAIAPLVGMGPYDYGNLLWRYPMEASNDVVSYAIFCALLYYIGREQRIRNAELAAAQLRAELARATLENLRLQLHPHFLFNALNAISSVMYEDVRRADAMLARLSEFLRTVLANEAQEVPLGDELDVERMYVDVMAARFEHALRFDVNVADGAHDAKVPFLVLQPLIENAIRHGVPPERGSIAITVEVARERDTTVISVADDGIGLRDGAGHGYGLKNVESRLRTLYDGGASFALGPAPQGGACATLRIPYVPAAGTA